MNYLRTQTRARTRMQTMEVAGPECAHTCGEQLREWCALWFRRQANAHTRTRTRMNLPPGREQRNSAQKQPDARDGKHTLPNKHERAGAANLNDDGDDDDEVDDKASHKSDAPTGGTLFVCLCVCA